MCAKSLSHVQLFATLWTVAHQAHLSMGFSRQEYWSGLWCPLLGDLPNPGIEPASLSSLAWAGGFFTTSTTWEALSGIAAAAAAKSLQLCPTLCDPLDGSLPGSPVPGILQARILEWVAISFSRGSSRPRDQTHISWVAGGFFITVLGSPHLYLCTT